MKKQIFLLISLFLAQSITHASFKQSARFVALAAQARTFAASAAQQTKKVLQSTRTKINQAYAHPKVQRLLERPGLTIVLPLLVFDVFSIVKSKQETKAYEAELDRMDRAENMTRFLQAQTIKDKPGFTITWDKPFPENVQNLIKAVIYTCNIPGNYTITEDPSLSPIQENNAAVTVKEENGTLHVTIECNTFLYNNLLDSTKKDTVQSYFLGTMFHELGHVSKRHAKQKIDFICQNLILLLILDSLFSPFYVAKYNLLSTAQKLVLHKPIIKYLIGFDIIYNQICKQHETQADLYACAHAQTQTIECKIKYYKNRFLQLRQSIKDDIRKQFLKLLPNIEQDFDKAVRFTYDLIYVSSTHPTDMSRAQTFNKESNHE